MFELHLLNDDLMTDEVVSTDNPPSRTLKAQGRFGKYTNSVSDGSSCFAFLSMGHSQIVSDYMVQIAGI